MARMTTHQVKHLVERIEKLYKTEYELRRRPYEKDLKIPFPEYSNNEKVELIRTKKATLKPEVTGDGHHYYMLSCFDYPMTTEQKRMSAMHTRAKNLRDVLFAEIEVRKQAQIDRAVLGDADTATSLLAAEQLRIDKLKAAIEKAKP